MYAIRYDVGVSGTATAQERAEAIVEGAVRSRKDYRGSGNPTFFTTTDTLNDLMLQKDKNGRRIYATQAELAAAMRVSNIVEIPVMENMIRTDENDKKEHKLLGIIVNLSDYTIGADRGGAVTMFDDFDIDYNKQTYLIETRLSGSLNKPYSAIILEQIEETKPVKLTVTVDDGNEERYSKKVHDLQYNVLMGSDFLCGKLRFVGDYTNFSSDTKLQSGHYLSLKMAATEEAEIYTQIIGGNSPEKQVEDGWCVYYIRDPEKQKIRVTAKKDGKVVAQKIFNLSNLVLA